MNSVGRVTSILVVSLLPCMLPLCAAFTFTPGAFHARSLQKVKVRRVSIDTVSEQNEERDTDDSPNAPLFDIEAIDEKASTYQVKDVSSQQTEVDYTLTYDDDSDDEDLYGGADDEDIFNQNVDQYRKDFIDVDAEAMGGSEFIRDDDDLLTERESRLYVNESGQAVEREKCILVGVEDLSAKYKDRKMAMSKNPEEWEVYFNLEQSMDEMRELIDTSGMDLAGEMIQRMNDVNPRTYIGTGKVQECQQLMDELGSCTVIFDAELSPGQQKALENAFNKEVIQNDFLGSEQLTVKVIDRTALILDIFAQHAKTREGKLQVDLALHEYRKPRLTKMWTHLERQSGAGGVGLRGPGESQLEIDKRLIRDRIIVLKRKIDSVQKQRNIHRKGRSNLGLPVLALVGYTNAGKSTLLNYLTRAGVMAENILFATLDPTTRKVKLPGLKTHPEVLLTDTVGFIQKLPTQLVAAFRATLEEVQEADVLVHVIDSSSDVWENQERAVKQVLAEIDSGDKPVVRVLNKIDLLEADAAEDLQYEAAMMSDHSVAISSVTGEGMVDLVSTIEDALMGLLVPIEVLLPYTNGKEVNMVQEVGHVEEIDYRDDGTYILARVPQAIANRLQPFDVNQEVEEANASKDEIDWVAIGRGRHAKKETEDVQEF
uniref:Hflx-type G domain-containing protein n=1 Tax=Chaetoceros debilis TaxID=122233 RepID=A0A7S3Q0Z1_9STRA